MAPGRDLFGARITGLVEFGYSADLSQARAGDAVQDSRRLPEGSASPETADAACAERGIRRRFGESSAVRYRHCLVAGGGGIESPAAGPGSVGLPLCFLWQAHARSVTLVLALCLYPANRGRSGGNPGMELNSA